MTLTVGSSGYSSFDLYNIAAKRSSIVASYTSSGFAPYDISKRMIRHGNHEWVSYHHGFDVTLIDKLHLILWIVKSLLYRTLQTDKLNEELYFHHFLLKSMSVLQFSNREMNTSYFY